MLSAGKRLFHGGLCSPEHISQERIIPGFTTAHESARIAGMNSLSKFIAPIAALIASLSFAWIAFSLTHSIPGGREIALYHQVVNYHHYPDF
jgi:hypothetical protein